MPEMSVSFSSKLSPVLYKNRYCEQEDFDIIVSGNTVILEDTKERKVVRISSHDFDKTETVYHSKRHWESDRTIFARSNVLIVRPRIRVMRDYKLRIKNKFVESFKIYLHKTNQWISVIETPDDRCNFSACSFIALFIENPFKNDFKNCCWLSRRLKRGEKQ